MGTVASNHNSGSSPSTPLLSHRLPELASSIQEIPSSSPPSYDEVVQHNYSCVSAFDNLSDQPMCIREEELAVQTTYDKIALCELEKYIVYLNSEINKLKQEQRAIQNQVIDENHTEQLVNDILTSIDKSREHNHRHLANNNTHNTNLERDGDLMTLRSAVKISIEATKHAMLSKLYPIRLHEAKKIE